MLSKCLLVFGLLIFSSAALASDSGKVSDAWIANALEKMRKWRGNETRIVRHRFIRNSAGKDWLAVVWNSPQTFRRLNIYRVDQQEDGSFKLKTLWDFYNQIMLFNGIEESQAGDYLVLHVATDMGGSTTEFAQDLKIALKGNAPLLTPLNCDYMFECPWDKTTIFDNKPSKYRSDR